MTIMGRPKDQQEKQVHQHEGGAAVFSGNVGETPYVSQAYGTSCGNQNEP